MTAINIIAAVIIVTAAINLVLKNKYFSTCTYMSQLYLVLAIGFSVAAFNSSSWVLLSVGIIAYAAYAYKLIQYLIALRTLPYGLKHVAKRP